MVPLDHPRRTAILPFMNDRFWFGMNGDWLAAVDEHGDWVLANIYTHRVIDLPSTVTCGIEHVSYPYGCCRYASQPGFESHILLFLVPPLTNSTFLIGFEIAGAQIGRAHV